MTPLRRQRRSTGREAGYTLLELLVVLVIIGLIAALATPQVMNLLGGAKHDSAKLQMESIESSLEFFQLDIGGYPANEQGLHALWTRPDGLAAWRGPYVRKETQLKDPWGRPYIYLRGDNANGFKLRSLGADGREGGTGDDADIELDK